MIATGNHCNFDSLRGAPLPKGEASLTPRFTNLFLRISGLSRTPAPTLTPALVCCITDESNLAIASKKFFKRIGRKLFIFLKPYIIMTADGSRRGVEKKRGHRAMQNKRQIKEWLIDILCAIVAGVIVGSAYHLFQNRF